jgi:hypothetical protein
MVELADQQKQTVQRVKEAFFPAERVHRSYRDKWNRFYELYSNYTDSRKSNGMPRDWDPPARENWAARGFGAELFIPLAFSTVETVLPRAISQRPRMLVTPRPLPNSPYIDPALLDRLDENADNHRLILDAQQDKINYELVLQDVAKNGFIYGLGVQKTYWKQTQRIVRRPEPHVLYGWQVPCIGEHREVTFNDNFAEAVDPFDFFWDPFADSVETANYVVHRLWRNTRYVMDMLQSGAWGNGLQLSEEDVRSSMNGARYTESQQRRLTADGQQGDYSVKDLHEVWEFHDGDRVITVLNREIPVQDARNPAWHGEIPFQVFRPTKIPGRMVGKGEIEPIVDLQEEINTMRSMRLDANTLSILRSYFYQEGTLDPQDFVLGNGVLIPTMGDPNDVIVPVPIAPLPAGHAEDEDRVKGDVDRTSGINDQVAGGDALSSTATGAQLVEAAAGARIRLKSQRLEVEVIKGAARQWLANNQQRIVTYAVKKPALPSPDQPDNAWSWAVLTPAELAGEFLVAPDGGSTAPDNVPQKRQDGLQILQGLMPLAQGGLIDPHRLALEFLRKFDIKDPERFLQAPQPQGPDPNSIPSETLDLLQKAGVPAQMIAQAVQAAKADELRQAQGQAPMGQPPNQQPQLPPAPAGAGAQQEGQR